MAKVKQFFGWLFMTQGYLDSLSDDEILIKACSSKREAYARGYAARKIDQDTQRINELMDRLNLIVLSPPTLIFYEPPAAPEQTEAQKRDASRIADVTYRAVPPTRKTRIVKE